VQYRILMVCLAAFFLLSVPTTSAFADGSAWNPNAPYYTQPSGVTSPSHVLQISGAPSTLNGALQTIATDVGAGASSVGQFVHDGIYGQQQVAVQQPTLQPLIPLPDTSVALPPGVVATGPTSVGLSAASQQQSANQAQYLQSIAATQGPSGFAAVVFALNGISAFGLSGQASGSQIVNTTNWPPSEVSAANWLILTAMAANSRSGYCTTNCSVPSSLSAWLQQSSLVIVDVSNANQAAVANIYGQNGGQVIQGLDLLTAGGFPGSDGPLFREQRINTVELIQAQASLAELQSESAAQGRFNYGLGCDGGSILDQSGNSCAAVGQAIVDRINQENEWHTITAQELGGDARCTIIASACVNTVVGGSLPNVLARVVSVVGTGGSQPAEIAQLVNEGATLATDETYGRPCLNADGSFGGIAQGGFSCGVGQTAAAGQWYLNWNEISGTFILTFTMVNASPQNPNGSPPPTQCPPDCPAGQVSQGPGWPAPAPTGSSVSNPQPPPPPSGGPGPVLDFVWASEANPINTAFSQFDGALRGAAGGGAGYALSPQVGQAQAPSGAGIIYFPLDFWAGGQWQGVNTGCTDPNACHNADRWRPNAAPTWDWGADPHTRGGDPMQSAFTGPTMAHVYYHSSVEQPWIAQAGVAHEPGNILRGYLVTMSVSFNHDQSQDHGWWEPNSCPPGHIGGCGSHWHANWVWQEINANDIHLGHHAVGVKQAAAVPIICGDQGAVIPGVTCH